MTNSRLFELARAFAKAYPTRPPSRSSKTWDQLCGVLTIQFGGYVGGATTAQIKVDARPWWKTSPSGAYMSSAILASKHSGDLGEHASEAPIGAFHFFDIGQYGHVGVDLNGGGSDVLMATAALRWSWGSSIGVQSVTGYRDRKGARYLGWSMNYAGGTMKLPAETAPAGSGTRITEESEIDMTGQIQFYKRSTNGDEWMIAGLGLEGGYEVTLDVNVARMWGRQYSGEGTVPIFLARPLYIETQKFWKAAAAKWQAQEAARIRAAVGAPAAGSALSDADVARIAKAVAALPVPEFGFTGIATRK